MPLISFGQVPFREKREEGSAVGYGMMETVQQIAVVLRLHDVEAAQRFRPHQLERSHELRLNVCVEFFLAHVTAVYRNLHLRIFILPRFAFFVEDEASAQRRACGGHSLDCLLQTVKVNALGQGKSCAQIISRECRLRLALYEYAQLRLQQGIGLFHVVKTLRFVLVDYRYMPRGNRV